MGNKKQCPVENCWWPRPNGDGGKRCTLCVNPAAYERAMEEPEPVAQLDESVSVRGDRCIRILHNMVKRKYYDPEAHKRRRRKR